MAGRIRKGGAKLPRFFATTNKNKFREVSLVMKGRIKQISIDFIEPQSLDIDYVARFKAEYAYKAVGEAVLIEDTSLEIDALNGLPGTLTKFFLERIKQKGILELIKDSENRDACAVTEFALFDGKKFITAISKLKGKISLSEHGNSYGWDTIFIPEGSTRTYAELGEREKVKYSMRTRALKGIISKLEKY